MPAGVRGPLTAVAILVSIIVIGALDLNTGRPYSFAIFYVLPTAAAAWYLRRPLGIAAGIMTGLVWGAADYVVRTDQLPAIVWNGFTRIAVFIAVAYLIGTLRYLIRALRRNEVELRSLLGQREEFLSLMAHEIRAPVAAIEIVATGLSGAPELGVRERRALGQLVSQARSLSALAEGVLSASQIEAGTIQLEPEHFDLRGLFTELLEVQGRVTVTVPGTPVVVYADREAMRRAIANVVGNARKFSAADQTVEIELGCSDGDAVVSVTDHGIGLAADELPHLFQKFSRVRNEATHRIEGVGLGLYFTRLILGAHGGSIRATSRGRGLGATFRIVLPLPVDTAPPAASLPRQAHG